ncbi:hypothetical protein BDV96DRAFT_605762 [Lophiotrema nucula]|uniref:Fungal N-terminal domain-containing protein n=1 Tax=Lophiotrema nucula TaxID=690887 RepID=A0A6A5YPS1_9PLEO|nr:hypothetical protein BDV96DRAFT_605762 [Lophiotrema nucula]
MTMSGLEVVGVVASIIQVADAGLRISQTVYAYVDSVKSSDKRLKDVADHLKVTCDVVRHVADLFDHDEFGKNVGGKEISTANDCVSKCNEAFAEVEDYVKKANSLIRPKVDLVARTSKWRFPLREKKLDLLDARLEQLKSSLLLMLNVIKYKNDIKAAIERKEQGLISDQRLLQEIQALRKSRDSSDSQYEQQRQNIEMLALSTVTAKPSSALGHNAERSISPSTAFPASREPTSLATGVDPVTGAPQSPFDAPMLGSQFGKNRSSTATEMMESGFLEIGPTASELELCSNHIRALLDNIQSMQELLHQGPVDTLSVPKTSQLYEQYCTSNTAWERTMTRHYTSRTAQMGAWHRNMASFYDKIEAGRNRYRPSADSEASECSSTGYDSPATPRRQRSMSYDSIGEEAYRASFAPEQSRRFSLTPKPKRRAYRTSYFRRRRRSPSYSSYEDEDSEPKPKRLRSTKSQNESAVEDQAVQLQEIEKMLREWTSVYDS